MKRKSLTAIKKVKKNIKKIKLYLKFKSIIFNNIKKENFTVGVSGGADSLCLAYFSKIYISEFKNKMDVIIVDHKLRKESKNEALQVKEILRKKGIKSKIINWKGKIPKKNIQFNARNIRYSLLEDYCVKKNIKYLVVGHHMDDQIENFFIRLFRGSGLTGLSSMSENVNYNKKLKIIRPFLSFKKKDLEKITLNYFKEYISDPSNEDEKYLRTRVRKYKKAMEKEGLDTTKIIKTVNNLFSANKAINFYKKKALYKHVTFLSKDRCLISEKIFNDEAGEIIFKSFSEIFLLISNTYYPPRSKKIINLISNIQKNRVKKSTLGGCVIEKKDGFISVSKEQRVRKASFRV